MTKDEFQRETNDFMTRDGALARAKADQYNRLGVEGDTIVAVKFGDQWCLMLDGSFNFMKAIGMADGGKA